MSVFATSLLSGCPCTINVKTKTQILIGDDDDVTAHSSGAPNSASAASPPNGVTVVDAETGEIT